MLKSFDVVVIGAGITGLSSAYHIKRMKDELRVAIVDKKTTSCQGNTARSSSAFRNLFSSEVNRKITQSTIEFYRHVQFELGFDLGMHINGYLFLGDNKFLGNPTFRRFVDQGMARYVDEESLCKAGFRTRPSDDEIGLMNLSNIEGGLLGYECGILSPEKICEFYVSELRKMGVEFFFGTEVFPPSLQPETKLDYPGEPFIWQRTTLKSLETSSGSFTADTFVFCTDVWTDGLLEKMGIDGHTRGKKRQVFQVTGPGVLSLLHNSFLDGEGLMPVTILPSHGIVLRPEPQSKSIWVTIAEEYNRDFSVNEDTQPEPEFYERGLFPVVVAYLPQFRDSRVTSMWAGHYAYNTIDRTHYVFEDKNIIVATGSSGSGIMKADAIGRVVASLYSGRKRTTLYGGYSIDTSALGVHGRRVKEEEMVI